MKDSLALIVTANMMGLSALAMRHKPDFSSGSAPGAIGSPYHHPRILLAEDELANQEFARNAVERLGYRVDIVATGIAAIDAWESGVYHLILMDCQMPVMDGRQATREIRQRERERGTLPIPIIALTADAIQETEQECRAAGMDGYLTKPLDRASIACTLAELLDGSGIDWVALEAVTDGDLVFMKELVELFIESGDAALEQIRAALLVGDFGAIERASHSLKGATANVGANAASSAAARLEDAAQTGSLEAVARHVILLRHETYRAVADLRRHCSGDDASSPENTVG